MNVNKKERKLALSTKLEGTSTHVEENKQKKVIKQPQRKEAQESQPSRVKGSLQIALENAMAKENKEEDSNDSQ